MQNINVNYTGEQTPAPKESAVVIPLSTFSENSPQIFNSEGYQTIGKGGEAALPNYQILREQSFASDLGPDAIVNDYYLKAVHTVPGSSLAEPPEPNCWVKIVPIQRVPIGHRNMMINESTKILRHFSAFEPLNQRVHRILDIFLVQETYLYLFYEPLANHKSLHQLLHGLPSDYSYPPPDLSPNKDCMLTVAKLQVWMRDLAQTVDFKWTCGASALCSSSVSPVPCLSPVR